MTKLFYLFAVSASLACILAAVGVWSHRKVWVKVSAVLMAALFLPTVYLSYTDLLSRPKPASLEWWQRDAAEATVIASRLREGESIFLWLEMQGESEPRFYVLPWSQPVAKQLYGAQRQAEAMGTKVNMRKPFSDQRNEQEPIFYPQPQPALPPKNVPADNGIYFRHSSQSRPGHDT